MQSLKYYYNQIGGNWIVAGYNVGPYAITALPQIIWCAQNRSMITYEMIARNVNLPEYFFIPANFHLFVKMSGHIAGLIGDYCSYLDIPPLNALIVRTNGHVPGDGIEYFLKTFGIDNYKKLKLKQKKLSLNDHIYPLIFNNGIWDSLLNANDTHAHKPQKYILHQDPQVPMQKYADNSSVGENTHGGERNPHKLLKEYVINNCQNIPELEMRGCRKKNADDEFVFPSMDRADIFFNNEKLDDEQYNIACEIKSYCSDDNDIKRGIFQCVKYRALLNADNKLNKREKRSKCFLIVQRELPLELREIAKILNVPYIVLRPEQVGN